MSSGVIGSSEKLMTCAGRPGVHAAIRSRISASTGMTFIAPSGGAPMRKSGAAARIASRTASGTAPTSR